ncbi:MAG: ELWxxDGT repeat protein [Flavobacterium circumlabens]|uniref:ELWxxDGT repeat protein n=1 Tax=Flavobacterium circumlabens TaxID=2133765 RepID=UPI003266B8EE
MKYNFTLLFIIAIFNFSTAQTIDAKLLEINFHEDGAPQNLTASESGFYFTATDGDFDKYGRELWHSDGTVKGTSMVKDINPGGNSSAPNSLIWLNNVLYFTASNGVLGTELWKSDGTEIGTLMIKDIRTNNNDFNGPSNLLAFNGKLYFTATDGINGSELWTSDGTESGTYMLKNINPTGDSNPDGLFVFNNNLYFIANDGTNGVELWKSDGTQSGTAMLKNINANSTALYVGNQFLIMNNNFYFFANDGIKGYELWKSDGTESGTQIVKDIRAGNNFSQLVLKGAVLNNIIIFEANNGINGAEVWKSDGTESGTSMIRDINNTSSNSIMTYNSKFIEFNNEVYFLADDNIHGGEIWKTDGTAAGTILLKDINNGNSSVWIEKFHVDKINNKLLFFTTNDNSSERKLWASDGTLYGTLQISNIKAYNGSGVIESFVTIKNRTFLSGENERNGMELWSTDGTVSGTSLFADVNYSNGSNPSKFANANGNVFFRAGSTPYGTQLFKSDGSIEGTQLMKDIIIDNLSDIVINGNLFFSGGNSTHGYELWKSDGTEIGTVMVKDINPGNNSSMLNYNQTQLFTVINNILYFYADDGVNGFELWRSDGTESGTYMIKDIKPNSGIYNDGSYPRYFTVLNNIIYFIADDNSGSALWTTNGTASGTVKIINLNDIRVLKTVNNKLIIVAETSGTGYGPRDLWASDGTTAGTKLLKTFADSYDSDIHITTTLNNELYFVAKSPNSLRTVFYKTDGTVEGTMLLFDETTHPTIPDFTIKNILTCGNYVYFSVQDELSRTDKELWRTNGSITEKIAEQEANESSSIRNLTCYNDNLLYLAETFPHKIWLVNNNLTKPLDININVVNGKNFDGVDNIEELAASNNNLYFAARNDISGSELYITKINTSSLGISDYNNSQNSTIKQVTVYPNPANQYVIIKSVNDFEIVKFQLCDSTGKKIDEQLNKEEKRELKYDVSRLQTGIYFIKVTLSNGKINDLKLVVN